jgi:hypothetical protein
MNNQNKAFQRITGRLFALENVEVKFNTYESDRAITWCSDSDTGTITIHTDGSANGYFPDGFFTFDGQGSSI